MIATHLDAAFVEGMGHDVVIEGARYQRVVEEGLEFKGATHTPEFEVAQKELTVGQTGVDSALFEI